MTISVPFQIIDLHGDGFHPLVNVVIHDKQFTLVLDTGASKTAFDHDTLNQFEDIIAITSSDRLSTGLGTNNMTSFTAIINTIHIGDLSLCEFEVAVLDLSSINIAYRQLNHPEVLGVLGGDILMKYKAVIDYGKKVLKFKV
jgi:hypothetical protein